MHPKRFYLSTVAAIGLAALLAPVQAGAQTAVAIDNDDIGGVVTGPNGPEAGVWVIAETNDLATRFTRSVVTDDQGRYVVPDLPKAKYKVWVRGYGLVDSAEGRFRARQAAQSHRRARPQRGRGGAVLSGDLLVLHAQDSGRGPVRRQERHSPERETVRLAQPDEEQRLRRLPSARPGVDPHHPEGVRRLQDRRRRLDPPHPVRAGGRAHGQHPGRPARRRALQVFRRLDRSDRQGRVALRQADPALRRRAQRRRHDLGLVRREALSPRSLRLRQAQPDGQRLRPGVRTARILHRPHPDPQPGRQQRRDLQGAGARREHAHVARTGPCRHAQAAAALGLLGRRGRSGTPRSTTTTP